MSKKTYQILTYGCQMNEHDSEKLAGMLENMGYQPANGTENADIILFNTCTVREKANLKVFGKVGSLKQLKEKNSELIIGIGGCMMQDEKAAEEIYEKYPHVDLIFGTHNLHHVPDLIREIRENRNRVIEVWDEKQGLIPDVPTRRKNDFQAWVSIIRGCNNFCSYCIVPYVRGREKSRPQKDIVKEVEKLVADGVKEITLLGQNVHSYGQDLKANITFPDLLKKLDDIDGLKRIRYMTSHPRDFSEQLINAVRDGQNICEHFHLPVQSGSTRILQEMNRGYTREEYIEKINKIRSEIPEAAVTTDIIVGFPGETGEDFRNTLSLVKELKFDMAFTFSYSPRRGTPAAELENQLPEEVKSERLQKLMGVQNKISRKKNKAYLGKTVNVLIEGESKNNPETLSVRTRSNKLVIIPRRKDIIGEIVEVEIEEVKSWTLYGKET
ncbi:MAG: tRNA (N6-isopentenyl adenosine(37)-C2)-methylthiotransferase MiaB [Halanaerobiales bacterium]